MKIKITFALCCATLFFASCNHVFYPAMYHQDVTYMPTPTSVDSAKSVTYISGGLGVGGKSDGTDELWAFQLNVSRGYKFDNFVLAYGVFGVAGNYNNGNINEGQPYYFTNKFYGSVGGRVAASYVITTEKTDIRIIGLEAAYSHEFGSYAIYRNNVYNNLPSNYYVDPTVDLYTIGLTSEVMFHKYTNSKWQHGINFFFGETLNPNLFDGTLYTGDDNTFNQRFFRNAYFKAGYFVKHKNVFGVAEISPMQIDLRFGFTF